MNAHKLRDRSPLGPVEWERYYDLRWRVLRAPWGQPVGTERDEVDSASTHVALWDGVLPVAAGRLHFNSPSQAQVRYMVVEPSWQRQGLGSRVLSILEAHATTAKADHIVLNAREEVLAFYRGHGYQSVGPAGMLFGSIPHFRMSKNLLDR